MSFDIFLQRFVKGQSVEVPRPPLLAVLKATKHSGPDAFGFYGVTLSDGSELEFSAGGLESDKPFTGCAVHLHSLSDPQIRFVFEIAAAGGMAIMPAMEDAGTLLVPGVYAADLPASLSEALRGIPVASPDELGVILAKGYGPWSKYRDQVVSGRPKGEPQ